MAYNSTIIDQFIKINIIAKEITSLYHKLGYKDINFSLLSSGGSNSVLNTEYYAPNSKNILDRVIFQIYRRINLNIDMALPTIALIAILIKVNNLESFSIISLYAIPQMMLLYVYFSVGLG